MVFRTLTLVGSLAMLWSAASQGTETQPVRLTPYAKVEHPPIDEMSGIVKSRRYANTYWVHNDSGDEPRMFAIRANGTTISPVWQNRRADAGVLQTAPPEFKGVRIGIAANFDWEDIAYDGDNLYLCDVGNNGNARRDLGIYVVPEPNPEQIDQSRTLKWLPVAYADQREFPPRGAMPFDCEGVFWLRGKLYFVTKHRRDASGTPDVSANLYRLDTQHTGRVNVLTKVDVRADLGGWVTGADVSPDGRTLAILTQAPAQSVWLFDTTVRGDRFLSGPARRIPFTNANQAEAVCFDGNGSLIVTNEQREMFRLSVGDAKLVRP
jgi:hypothetical protein